MPRADDDEIKIDSFSNIFFFEIQIFSYFSVKMPLYGIIVKFEKVSLLLALYCLEVSLLKKRKKSAPKQFYF